MKTIIASLKILFQHISRDGMLIALCIAPPLALLFLYYIIPTYIAPLLPFDIAKYYLLFDLMIAVMTPSLLCFASAMVVLEEIDENIAPYLSVTPIGKDGYITSRLIVPVIISAVITILFLALFSLIELSIVMIITISFSTALLAMISSMIIISIAKNKVEGLALNKISGVLITGIVIPFFITSDIQYLFGFMPSFWIAKLAISDNYLYLLPIIISLSVWIAVLWRVYRRRLL